MECNRDEAVRSRCIAEQKFLQHDVLGARKFALKAQYLFPDLEGLPQLLAVLDVHIVAQQKVDGLDVNWYGILQTDASADDVTIRKQYRKLALVLHPDKNKAVGAEAAFKLISEAWRVLSDKEKKAVHDARRSSNGVDLSAMKSMRGFCNFARFNGVSLPKASDNLKRSFWTSCPSCKMQFEFIRVHENKSISCPTCSKVFKAAEMQDIASGFRGQPPKQTSCAGRSSCPEKQAQKDGGSQDHEGSSFSFHWGPHRFNAAKYANATAQMVQQTYEAVRRERIKAQKEAREKAATARMEAEIEAIRRDLEERKQRKKEKQKRVTRTLSQQHERDAMPKGTFSQGGELGRANSGKGLPGEEFGKGNVWMSSVITSTDEESASGTRGKSMRMDQTQESYWCRMSRGFDSTNACEASDAFAFSKRLKIDVQGEVQ